LKDQEALKVKRHDSGPITNEKKPGMEKKTIQNLSSSKIFSAGKKGTIKGRGEVILCKKRKTTSG